MRGARARSTKRKEGGKPETPGYGSSQSHSCALRPAAPGSALEALLSLKEATIEKVTL